MNNRTVDRLVSGAVPERMRAMPAVVLTGSRQTGKSTLVQQLVPGNRTYYTLDDLDVVATARRDPDALVGGRHAVTIDEVQREPELLNAVKLAIDENRTPGRFLLTGSANLLLMRSVSESLAGRASYLTLWPMTRSEQRGEGRCGCWDALLEADDAAWPGVLAREAREEEDWRALARRGGYPTPAVHMRRADDRAVWFDGYVRTYLERDLQDVSSVAALPDFRRLMRAAALRIGQIVNQSDLGRDVALPQPTVHRYLNLLETSYLLVRLPAYAVNRTKRLIKSPKIYWGDTGLALFLAGSNEPTGACLENIILHDLLAWRDTRIERPELSYWRTTTGMEVDLVIEDRGQLLPIEIKASGRPRLSDTEGLRAFRSEHADRARSGLLLHNGSTTTWLSDDVLAAPWWSVL